VVDLDACAPLIRAVLDAQGWMEMVEDHCPTIEDLVREFYANLHRRVGDSFYTWVKEKEIHVTLNLISTITEAPWVRNPEYPWPVDHLPTRVEMVECFAEGRPHQMETKGKSRFQIHDFSNEVRCIYRIVMSRVLPVLSLTLITMEKARCLYVLLTEATIDYGSIIMTTMMLVWVADSSTTLPYVALITWIVQNTGVVTKGMIELVL
jgi:hypothetical protein